MFNISSLAKKRSLSQGKSGVLVSEIAFTVRPACGPCNRSSFLCVSLESLFAPVTTGPARVSRRRGAVLAGTGGHGGPHPTGSIRCVPGYFSAVTNRHVPLQFFLSPTATHGKRCGITRGKVCSSKRQHSYESYASWLKCPIQTKFEPLDVDGDPFSTGKPTSTLSAPHL